MTGVSPNAPTPQPMASRSLFFASLIAPSPSSSYVSEDAYPASLF